MDGPVWGAPASPGWALCALGLRWATLLPTPAALSHRVSLFKGEDHESHLCDLCLAPRRARGTSRGDEWQESKAFRRISCAAVAFGRKLLGGLDWPVPGRGSPSAPRGGALGPRGVPSPRALGTWSSGGVVWGVSACYWEPGVSCLSQAFGCKSIKKHGARRLGLNWP